MALTLYGNFYFCSVLWLSLRCLCVRVALCLLAIDSPVTDQISRPHIRKRAAHLPPRGIIPTVNNSIYWADYLLWLHRWSQLKSSMFDDFGWTPADNTEDCLWQFCSPFVCKFAAAGQPVRKDSDTFCSVDVLYFFFFEIKKKKQDQNNNSTTNFGVYLPQTIYFGEKQLQLQIVIPAACYLLLLCSDPHAF